MRILASIGLLLSVLFGTAPLLAEAMDSGPTGTMETADYGPVEALMHWNFPRLMFRTDVAVHWGEQDHEFRYSVNDRAGRRHMQVNVNGGEAVVVPASEGTAADALHVSPDGKWEAFAKGSNIYVRSRGSGDEVQLSFDGTPLYAYGTSYFMHVSDIMRSAASPERAAKFPKIMPVVAWSPDSRRLLVQRWDARGIRQSSVISSSGRIPAVSTFPYPLPEDPRVDSYDFVIFDIVSRRPVPVQIPPQPYAGFNVSLAGPGPHWVQWSGKSDQVFVLDADRGINRIALMSVDASTGQAKEVLVEQSDGRALASGPDFRFPGWRLSTASGDIFWYSWRSGWGHIYRYDVSGRLKNAVTRGEWTVNEIEKIDVERGKLYFSAYGRERDKSINHKLIYRISFDGSGIELLTPEDAMHDVVISPNAGYMVDTYSTAQDPPVSVLRSMEDGRVIKELERADVSDAVKAGWVPPRTFKVKAVDGKTDLYGLMFLPSKFDPGKVYPVIDHSHAGAGAAAIFGGWRFARRYAGGSDYYPYALAQLGTVVIQVEARGRHRSWEDYNAYHGQIGISGLPDRVAAIQQLAQRHPFMDAGRVGVVGASGGGLGAAAGILRYPDFYKVAVSIVGNLDNRMYVSLWGDRFQGVFKRDAVTGADNYEQESVAHYASNLKGKLFIVHGEVDDNVLPSQSLNLVHALIKENKDFDMLIVPGEGHGAYATPYVIRKTLDYFALHLLGKRPPEAFRFKPPPEYAYQ